MYVYILITQREDDPEIAGVFSSFDKAVAHFVRTKFKDATMPVAEMQSKVAQVALKMAHMTDDEDFADFGDTRVWIEKHGVDDCCEDWEKGDGGDRK